MYQRSISALMHGEITQSLTTQCCAACDHLRSRSHGIESTTTTKKTKSGTHYISFFLSFSRSLNVTKSHYLNATSNALVSFAAADRLINVIFRRAVLSSRAVAVVAAVGAGAATAVRTLSNACTARVLLSINDMLFQALIDSIWECTEKKNFKKMICLRLRIPAPKEDIGMEKH